jgi:hypothetical protein
MSRFPLIIIPNYVTTIPAQPNSKLVKQSCRRSGFHVHAIVNATTGAAWHWITPTPNKIRTPLLGKAKYEATYTDGAARLIERIGEDMFNERYRLLDTTTKVWCQTYYTSMPLGKFIDKTLLFATQQW